MRRAVHEELGLFTPEEVRKAFKIAFRRTRGLNPSDEALEKFVESSSGHPYMIQLLGYNIVDLANVRASERTYTASVKDVANAATEALATYEQRALAPIVDELGTWEARYLQAMALLIEESLEASTGDVAKELGKEPSQLTYHREQLIRNGIILPTQRGKVRFGIPFLR